jgi:hypothetical protein
MKRISQSDRRYLLRWSVSLLVLVVAVFGFVQVAHMHGVLTNDDGPSSAVHCSICLAAHSVPVITAVSFTPVLALTNTFVAVSETQQQSQLLIPSSFIRPPPQVL